MRFSLATVAGEGFRNLDENAATGPTVMRRLRGVKQGRQAQTRPIQHSTIVHRRISVLNPGKSLAGYLVYAKKIPIGCIANSQLESEPLSTAKTKYILTMLAPHTLLLCQPSTKDVQTRQRTKHRAKRGKRGQSFWTKASGEATEQFLEEAVSGSRKLRLVPWEQPGGCTKEDMCPRSADQVLRACRYGPRNSRLGRTDR